MSVWNSTIKSHLDSFAFWWFSEISLLTNILINRRSCKDVVVDCSDGIDSIAALQDLKDKECYGLTLVIPESKFLQKKINLPCSTVKNLDAVIKYEFSKYFPLDVSEVIYSYKVEESGDKNVRVSIAAMPILSINSIVSSCVKKGNDRPRWVVCESCDKKIQIDCSEVIDCSLLDKTSHIRTRKVAIIVPFLVTLILLMPVLKIQIYNHQLEREISRLSNEKYQVIDYYNKLRAAERVVDNVVARKKTETTTIELLHVLTETLHGSAIVNSVSLANEVIKLEGTSIDKQTVKSQLNKISVPGSLKFEIVQSRLKRSPFKAELNYAKK